MRFLRGSVFVLDLLLVGCRRSDRVDPGVRTVEIRARGARFRPANIQARPGERIRLVFEREEPTCVTSVEFPTLGIEEDLPEGAKVAVSVTAPVSGAIPFRCPMDMARGEVRVR